MTNISDGHVPHEVYDEARRQTLNPIVVNGRFRCVVFLKKNASISPPPVIAINAWNRAAIAFRAKPRLTSVRIAA